MKAWLAIRHTLTQTLPVFVMVLALILLVGEAFSSEPAIIEQQSRLARRFAKLQAEHTALQRWVIDEFRPWVERQTKRLSEGLPSHAPTATPPPPPETAEPVPETPIPSVATPTPPPPPPTMTSPPPEPTPSPTCVVVVDICIESPLEREVPV